MHCFISGLASRPSNFPNPGRFPEPSIVVIVRCIQKDSFVQHFKKICIFETGFVMILSPAAEQRLKFYIGKMAASELCLVECELYKAWKVLGCAWNTFSVSLVFIAHFICISKPEHEPLIDYFLRLVRLRASTGLMSTLDSFSIVVKSFYASSSDSRQVLAASTTMKHGETFAGPPLMTDVPLAFEKI